MSNLTWAQAFPGGVTDRRVQHAMLRDAAGRCALLRLRDGALLWRSTEALRPLLLDDELALGLALGPPRLVAWSLQGDERWRSPVLPWPDWATKPTELNRASDLHAGWIDGDAFVSWQLRAARGGGAGRGPGYAPAASCEGAVRLRRDGGALIDMTAAQTAALADGDVGADADATAAGDAQATASDDPRVLAQRVLAGTRYTLMQLADGGRLRTAVVAEDAGAQAAHQAGKAFPPLQNPGASDARWTCWLDDIEPRQAPPLRP